MFSAHSQFAEKTRQSGTRPLTTRELEVSSLLDLRDKDIAHKLAISIHTVRAHVGSAMRKLGVETRTALKTAVQREEI